MSFGTRVQWNINEVLRCTGILRSSEFGKYQVKEKETGLFAEGLIRAFHVFMRVATIHKGNGGFRVSHTFLTLKSLFFPL